MKKDEFKRRLIVKLEELVDVYYGDNNIIDKLTNSTLKVFIDTNTSKIDSMLNGIADENGEINVDSVIGRYAEVIPDEGINIDIKQYVKNDFINGLLPNKTLNITKDDITNIIKE